MAPGHGERPKQLPCASHPGKRWCGGAGQGRGSVCVCWKAAYLQPWRAPNCLPVISSLTPALLFVMAARWQAVHHRFPLNRLTFIISPQKNKKISPQRSWQTVGYFNSAKSPPSRRASPAQTTARPADSCSLALEARRIVRSGCYFYFQLARYHPGFDRKPLFLLYKASASLTS